MRIASVDAPEERAAKNEYWQAICRDEAAEPWFKLMCDLPAALDVISPEKAEAAIIHTLKVHGDFQGLQFSYAHFREANVGFREFPDLEYLTGTPMCIPVVEFSNLEAYRAFRHAARRRIPDQGFTIFVDTEFLMKAMGVTFPKQRSGIRPTGIIICCSEQMPDQMPPEQISRHESVYCIDPLLCAREAEDRLILAELIATIGQFASPKGSGYFTVDENIINSDSEHWVNYYMQLPRVSDDLGRILWPEEELPDSLIPLDLADATVAFVRALTTVRKNSEIVRMLMKCLNFKEVRDQLRTIWPDM